MWQCCCHRLMKLGRQLLRLSLPEHLFQELARLLALGTGEAFGFDFGFALRRNNHFDGFHETPPTLIVSLIDPSASGCSVQM